MGNHIDNIEQVKKHTGYFAVAIVLQGDEQDGVVDSSRGRGDPVWMWRSGRSLLEGDL